jgi:hypothetical protein
MTYLELQVDFFYYSSTDENYTSQAFQPYIVGPVTHPNQKENNVFEI